MRLRLLAVSHFKAGKNRAEVAKTLNISRRIVNDWVANYLSQGIQGLESKKSTGRPSYITEQDKEILSQYIKAQCQSDMTTSLMPVQKHETHSLVMLSE